jgi:hypothetical protein
LDARSLAIEHTRRGVSLNAEITARALKSTVASPVDAEMPTSGSPNRWTSWTSAGWRSPWIRPAAVFGVWQARAFPGAQIVNEPGAMRWNEQMSWDFEDSKAFYAAVFGYEYGDTSGPFSYATFKVDGRVREPIDHPYGRMSTVADDQGALFSLLGVTPG